MNGLANPVCECGKCWFNYAMPIAAKEGAVDVSRLVEIMIGFLKEGPCPAVKRNIE